MECARLTPGETPLTELQALLASTTVTDICLNGNEEDGKCSLFVDEGNGLEARPFAWPLDELKTWVLEQISLAGRSWDARHPFVDASLKASGHRLHVCFPPLARQGLLVSLRRLAGTAMSGSGQLAYAKSARWSQSAAFPILEEAVRNGDSVLISGSTGSGKTTLASDLLACVPGGERIVALEDTPELAPAHPHFVTLVSRPPNADGFGEVTLRTLLRQSLRMRPDRIVLGECRGAEVLDLLQVLNTGHRGALATLHAHSPRDALRRAELLCLIAAGGAVPIPAIRELLGTGIQWIAQVRRTGPLREISELCHVEGREGDTILLRPVIASP